MMTEEDKNKYKVGFIFLYNTTLPLDTFSEKNKKKYKEKILLHKFNHIHLHNEEIMFNDHHEKISLSKLDNYLKSELNLNDNDVIDYNRVRKKLKYIDIYVILLNKLNQDNINTKLSDNFRKKYVSTTKLLFYSLNSIGKSNDICEAIINYHKKNNIALNVLPCKYKKIKLTFIDVLNSIIGLIAIDSETEKYI